MSDKKKSAGEAVGDIDGLIEALHAVQETVLSHTIQHKHEWDSFQSHVCMALDMLVTLGVDDAIRKNERARRMAEVLQEIDEARKDKGADSPFGWEVKPRGDGGAN